MGLLVDGKWQDRWYDTKSSGGRFVRSEAQFRNSIESGGRFAPEKGRYLLYVSLACPWAHRTLIFRHLKGLAPFIDVAVVNPLMLSNGWELNTGFEGATGDPLYGLDHLYQLYLKADADYSGRVTVPVLWDRKHETIVNNESSEIIRLFNSAFDAVGATPGDYYPAALRDEIDTVNARVYDCINNGVYKAGFATRQDAYGEAVQSLFEALDWLEGRLGERRYLCGTQITEADWRLFTTLVRFDPVYVGHFKCNLRRIADYPNLSNYLRELYQVPGVAATVDMAHIKHHYYRSHTMINPTGIVPEGPVLDLDQPHDRNRFNGEEAR